MATKTIQTTHLILRVFLGLGAIGGGSVLIVSPTGELMEMPLSFLDRSPFIIFQYPALFCLGSLAGSVSVGNGFIKKTS